MKYFETNRLIIRNLKLCDLTEFLSYRSNPEVVKYQNFDVFDQNQAEDFIREQLNRQPINDDQWTQLAIVEKDTEILIGDCAVKITPEYQSYIGITISPLHQNFGFAKECLSVLFSFLQNKHDVIEVYAIVDEQNLPSNKLMQSLGFRLEKRVENIPFKGNFCSELYYILRLTKR